MLQRLGTAHKVSRRTWMLFKGKNFTTEVIVVDNKSDDPTIFEIEKKYMNFKFIHNTVNGGFANGCNLGAKNAMGDFFLFLNPDTVAKESEVEKLLEIAVKNPDYGIVSCSQVNENGKESVASGQFPSLMNLTGFQRAIFRSRQDASLTQMGYAFPDWVSGSVDYDKKR